MKPIHGMSNTPFFKKWGGIKQRCGDKNNKNYGGRGIIICESWMDFENFRNDMYESYLKHINKHGKENTSIDRINVNGNYCPENCRWATRNEQANNTRCSRFFEYNGETKTIAQWAKKFNMGVKTLESRIKLQGKSIKEALETPIQKKRVLREKFSYKGKYGTLTYFSKKYNIKRSCLSRRIYVQKLSIDSALENPVKENKRTEFYYNGNSGLISFFSKKYNISHDILTRRVYKKKMTIAEAIGTSTKQKIMYTYKNDTDFLPFFGKKYGVLNATLYHRINKQKMSIKEAIETPLKNNNLTV
jgi:hypothetical protein